MADLNHDIEKYRQGKLTPAEMHALEKKALYDPFLADALEGASMIKPDELASDVAELNERISRKKQSVFTPLRIAAGIIVIIGVAMFAFWPQAEELKLSKLDQRETPPPTSNADSIEQQTSAAATQPDVTRVDEQLSLAEEKPVAKRSRNQPKPVVPEITEAEEPIAGVTKEDTATIAAADVQLADAVSAESQKAQPAGERSPAMSKRFSVDQREINGFVTIAEDKLPLPGVNVNVKGTTLGTVTDYKGGYKLNVPDNGTLVFSFVGMESKEVKIAKDTTMNVALNEDISQLSEVVITRAPMPNTDPNAEPVIRMAQPAGGIKAYNQYMDNNLRYPEQAIEQKIKGRVIVEFSVGISGEIGDFVVVKSLGHGCDEEVIRLVKEGPKWLAGTENNVPVESNVRVRMKFDPAKVNKTK